MSLLNMQIPLANGGFIQVTEDSSQGGFLLLKILKSDSTEDSSTPLSSAQAQGILQALSGVTSARRGMISAGI